MFNEISVTCMEYFSGFFSIIERIKYIPRKWQMQISGPSLRQKDCLSINSSNIMQQLFFHINLLILPFTVNPLLN